MALKEGERIILFWDVCVNPFFWFDSPALHDLHRRGCEQFVGQQVNFFHDV